MNSKAILAIFLIAVMMADSLHALNWQGTGSGLNQTVITEIWKDLTPNLNTAFSTNTIAGYAAFAKDISDRLNSKWDPAWNVVMVRCLAQYDVILYGYAFRNQWMWYNGVPNSATGSSSKIAALIVWKDYNCQDWKSVRDYSSSTVSFTTSQKTTIKTEATKLTQTQLLNDIWLATHSMMTNILANAEFSSGGYTVVMAQDGASSDFFGYVCRVGNNHYDFYRQNVRPIISNYGSFYLFQTR